MWHLVLTVQRLATVIKFEIMINFYDKSPQSVHALYISRDLYYFPDTGLNYSQVIHV
jgi:hypothetical protein